MRLRLRSFLLTSALTFAPAVASATTISGLYVDGGAGYNEVQDQHVHANSPADGPAAQKFTINHGTGYTGFGAIGYGFGNGLRVEAEGLYNSSEDEYTQNVEENNATSGGESEQALVSQLNTARETLDQQLKNPTSTPEYGQGPTYTPTTTSTYKPGTTPSLKPLEGVPDVEGPKYTIGSTTYYTEKNSSALTTESSLQGLSQELTQDQDAYNTYQTQVGEAKKNYDDYQSQVNTDMQEAQKASTSYQQDQQQAETSYKNYQNQVTSATQAANDAYQQYQDKIQQLMQANPKYKTLIESYEQQAEQSYNNYQNGLEQESQQVETSYNDYKDKLNKAIQSSENNQDDLEQDLQKAKNAYQQYQDKVKQFETKYSNYQDQLTQDQSTVNGDITTVTPVENNVTNNNIVDVIPFNTQIPGSKNSPVQQAAEKLDDEHDSGSDTGYTWSGGTATASGCDSTYSWCGAFGGAPVVVIQKINELPQWAAPSTTGTTGINNPPIIIPELKNNGASDIQWEPTGNERQWMYGLASPVADNDSTKMVSCTSCYYISTLTPDQAQQLYYGKRSSWGDNGTLPPLSQQTMNIPNTVGTGLSSGNKVPVEGPPFYCSDNQLCTSTGGGATYPNTVGGIYAGENAYVQQLMEDLSHDGVLTKGFYYFQGNIEGPDANSNQGGQVYKNYPNQQGYDNEVNNVGGNTYYPNINVNNPSIYGYPEPTPLPTCTNGSCTLNIGSTWSQSNNIWPEMNGGTQQGIGVVSTIPNFSGYGPFNYKSGSTGLMQISTPDTARMIARDHQIDFFAMRPPASSVSSISHSISDFRDALFVTPRSGSKVLSVPHASLMSYGFPMRSVSYHGRDQSYGGFANVLYDFDLERLFGLRSIVTPFVGGGAGYLWQRYDDMGPVAAASITGVHGGFAWQGIAGVAFDTGISGLQITAQYRMIGQPGSFYNGSFNYGTEGGHANFDQRFNHQFIVGFRYAFHNQPVHITPPSPSLPAALAAAAAPAPTAARSYLVFFDWNQYALTSRARQIVVEAAHATTYVHTTRINVNGYTDSSAAPGPAGQKYNYALSVKRARSVEAELIRNGVPASEIVIRGYGDSNPLVPTGPNTREPQNRRVEIILHA